MKTTLYKIDTKGKVREWTIEVQENKYRTIAGLKDGKKVTSEWTIVQGKSIGRSNETTPAEQALLVAESTITGRKDRGYSETITGANINTEKFKPMLAAKYDGKIAFPVLVQPKLDGIRCVAKKDGLWSRSGKPILSAPHIHHELSLLGVWDTYPDAILDGELYNHSLRDSFEKIISLTRKSKPTGDDLKESAQLIEYHVYDAMTSPTAGNQSWAKRNDFLGQFMMGMRSVVRVGTYSVYNDEQLDNSYADFMAEGYEGQMIRDPNASYQQKRTKALLKRKEFQDAEYTIVGVEEGKGNRSGMAGRVILRNTDGETFGSGIKGGESYYIKLLNDQNKLVGKKATIRFQNLSEKGVPRFPVCVAIRDYE